MTDGRSEALAAQVARVRASGLLGRSHGLARLFDYLADPVRIGRTLTEADVAHEVFGRTADLSGDASVRVYIHRLRKKLDDFYAREGSAEPLRLVIPVGEYRLELEGAQDRGPGRRPPRWLPWAAAAALLLLLNIAGAAWLLGATAPSRALGRLAEAPLWQGLGDERPVLMVVGDYYIFADTEGGDGPRRMVREFDVNSPADLDAWLMERPELQGRYVDLDTYYTPVGATLALRELMPLVRQAAGGPERVRAVTASQLTPQMMKDHDIVYVGYLSALRLLQQPVFARSRFQIGDTYDELVDRQTGRTYTSGAGRPAGGRVNRDYGYLAAFDGPSGNRIVIVAGARDIGVMQTAEVAAGAAGASLAPPGEALYEVEGVGRTNLSAVKVAP
jgi:hypothetical protein